MYVGQLRAAGLAKESQVGTLVAPPTEFIPYIPPDGFVPAIQLLESLSVRGLADKIALASQGPGSLNGMKLKWEASAENIGNLLMACFGTDTKTEQASFVITTGVNDKIDFKESGGSQIHATIAAGTYPMGADSTVNGSLCKAIKTAMDGASGAIHTYTVSFSNRQITITPSTGTVQILWNTGTNHSTAAYTILGFTNADTSDSSSLTSNSTTAIQVYSHAFTRLQASQLPSYSWWLDKGAKFPQFAGCMLNKLDLTAQAKNFVHVDTDWTGLSYDDTGVSHTPSYSAVVPWAFNEVVVNVDGSPILNYDNLKLSLDNFVMADHALSGSIWPAKIYSQGFEVTVAMDLFVEDATQYAKFLTANAAALNFVLTSTADITNAFAGTKYKLTLDIPTAKYSVASYPNAPGVIKIAFTARGIYTTGSTKTISATLINSVSTSY